MRLKPREILTISPESAERARADGTRENMRLGLAAQYEHSAELKRRGCEFQDTPAMSTYDRIFAGDMEDDKAATWSLNPLYPHLGIVLSPKHTITYGEYDHWQNVINAGGDVLIHSFEYTDPTHTAVRYLGAISFKMLYHAWGGHRRIIWKNGRQIHVTGSLAATKNGYTFDREAAIIHNSVKI